MHHQLKKNINCTLVQALRLCTGRTAHRGSRGISLLFLDHDTRKGEGLASSPGRSLPPGKTRYPLCRRLGGPQGRSGREENLVPTGIRSRTVQPVTSRYTHYATRPTPRALTFRNSVFCPHSVIMLFRVWSENKQRLFLYTALTDWFL